MQLECGMEAFQFDQFQQYRYNLYFHHINCSRKFKTAEETGKIERLGGEPIWSLSFALPKMINSTAEQLAIVDWNQTVGFYSIDEGGRPVC